MCVRARVCVCIMMGIGQGRVVVLYERESNHRLGYFFGGDTGRHQQEHPIAWETLAV